MQTQSNKLNFEGQKIFIGMDVHKKDWKVSIRSGELTYKTFTQKPAEEELENHLHRNFPGAVLRERGCMPDLTFVLIFKYVARQNICETPALAKPLPHCTGGKIYL